MNDHRSIGFFVLVKPMNRPGCLKNRAVEKPAHVKQKNEAREKTAAGKFVRRIKKAIV